MPVTSPASCVVLVPVSGRIEPDCDGALRELERRGYPVWRVPGYSAIDAARNQIATDALAQGFEEFLWIDADIAFHPDDVDRLRSHELPLCCGLYPKKGPREFACEFLPNVAAIRFGVRGGLAEVRYCGSGFLHVRRAVYETVGRELQLPVCNRRMGQPLVPYYAPVVITDPGGAWSLPEDFAFCERARRCGFKIMADTRVRLWHVGSYAYGWEDADLARERFVDFTFHRTPLPFVSSTPVPPLPPGVEFSQDWFSVHIPLWEKLLAPLAGKPIRALEIGVYEGRSSIWLLDRILTHSEASLTWIDTFAGGADQQGIDLAGLQERFRNNTRRYGEKVRGHVGRSQDVLREMRGEQFDLAYLDGSHEAPDVLSDAVLAWSLLKPGGLMGFDDYRWMGFPEPERRPAIAVDAFLRVLRGCYEELHRGDQVWIRKRSSRIAN